MSPSILGTCSSCSIFQWVSLSFTVCPRKSWSNFKWPRRKVFKLPSQSAYSLSMRINQTTITWSPQIGKPQDGKIQEFYSLSVNWPPPTIFATTYITNKNPSFLIHQPSICTYSTAARIRRTKICCARPNLPSTGYMHRTSSPPSTLMEEYSILLVSTPKNKGPVMKLYDSDTAPHHLSALLKDLVSIWLTADICMYACKHSILVHSAFDSDMNRTVLPLSIKWFDQRDPDRHCYYIVSPILDPTRMKTGIARATFRYTLRTKEKMKCSNEHGK